MNYRLGGNPDFFDFDLILAAGLDFYGKGSNPGAATAGRK